MSVLRQLGQYFLSYQTKRETGATGKVFSDLNYKIFYDLLKKIKAFIISLFSLLPRCIA